MAHIDKYKGKEHLLTKSHDKQRSRKRNRPTVPNKVTPKTITKKGGKVIWPKSKLIVIMRDCLAFVKENLGNNLVGVEIGVYAGENAAVILEKLPIAKLYLIDPYHSTEKSNETQITHQELQKIKAKARHLMFKYPSNKFIWIHKHSCDAVNDIPNNLDFVYMDADHSYEGIMSDLNLYYPKIKKGGVIGGHDFWKPSVIKAVREFKKRENLYLHCFNMRDLPDFVSVLTDNMDWWFIKEK